MPAFDALILAGGAGRRMGGVDKPALVVGGVPLLDRALAAVTDATHVVVVGPDRGLPREVSAVSEQPPGGGPLAAIAAGMSRVAEDIVVILACDMPLMSADTVRRLVTAAAATDDDGVICVDADGRRQPLAAAYRTRSVRRGLMGLGQIRDGAVRDLVNTLTLRELSSDPESVLDCDTWDDVALVRKRLEEP